MGTVTSVHLIIDPETGEFKRCGYVRMASGISLDEVVETLDGTYLIDREIVVSIARPQKPGMSKSGGNKQPWMKSGPKPAAASTGRPAVKTGKRPSPRPDAKKDSPLEQRQKPGKSPRPAAKLASRPDARTPQGKDPRTGSPPPRPRKSN
jgi:RNA recognition motif-containing protein